MSSSLIRAKSLYLQQPRARRPLRLGWFLGWFFLLTSALVFCLWSCLEVRKEAQQIAKLKRELLELRMINSQLRGEVSRLLHPERLEKIAKEQFGLIYPEPSQVVSLVIGEKREEVTMVRP